MRDYELTAILAGSLKEAEVEKVVAEIAEHLKKAKAKILKETKAAKRTLAYEVAKNSEGYYIYWELSMDPAEVLELDKKLRLVDKVIRYLLCRADR